ncbi:MAG: PAS domain S-box protein, partial [Gaiellaceae bacterium]
MPSDNLTALPLAADPGSEPQALRRHVAAIADLGHKAVSGSPIKELFDDACALVAAALAVELVSLVEAVGDELVLRAAAGWPDFDAVGRRTPRSLHTQAAYTLDVDDTVVLVDPAEETRFEVPEFLLEDGIVSGVSVPIRGPAGAFGVLAAHTRDPRRFSEDDTVFLRLVANVVAAAVESERVAEAARGQELARSASDARYRELFELATDLIFIFDADGLLVDANPAVEGALGFSRSELIGTHVELFVPAAEAHGPSVPATVYESELATKSGRTIPIQVSSRSIIRNGKPAGVLALARDISGQRATQIALEESERLFRSAFDDAPVGMLLTNAAGDLIRVNAAFARMVRYEAADLAGRTVNDIIHPDDLADAARHIDEMTAGVKDTFVTAERFVRSDGEVAWGHVGISAVRGNNGMPLYFVAQVEDVTELRRMQTELRESAALHSAVVESSRDLITVLDPDGTIRLISRSVREILGYTQEDLVGTNFTDLAHADDFAAAAGALAAATRGEDPLIFQVRAVAKNGAARTLDGKVSAVFDPAGNPTLLVTNSRDVTERISLEEQLRQSQKMEAIGKLAGGVAHDFNNLLTAINGYSDLALESLPPEEDDLRHSLEEIRRAGERAAELTRQLLAFSRQQVLKPEPVELSAIIEGYLAIFERLVGEDVTVHVKLDPKLPTVHADPGQLGQVLLNLVVNARDAMPDGGELRIETALVEIDGENGAGAPPGRYVTLAVTDTGLGMDELTVQRVFEPFFTTKPPGKGTGMGLSTVHGIVQQSGGTIVVRSKPNQGASFRVYLPVAGQTAATRAPEPSAAGRGDEATILVVEDEPLVRGIMEEMLESLGYRVLAAEAPHEAIAIAESDKAFDLVLTDVVMPEMNGHELALRLI